MLYLSPYKGSGTRADPFRPLVDTPGWTAIDLRDDPTVLDGWCLLLLPEASSNPALVFIGQNKNDPLSVQRRSAIGNKLGRTVTATNVQSFLQDILMPKIQPSKYGIKEVVLGNQVWAREVV